MQIVARTSSDSIILVTLPLVEDIYEVFGGYCACLLYEECHH